MNDDWVIKQINIITLWGLIGPPVAPGPGWLCCWMEVLAVHAWCRWMDYDMQYTNYRHLL